MAIATNRPAETIAERTASTWLPTGRAETASRVMVPAGHNNTYQRVGMGRDDRPVDTNFRIAAGHGGDRTDYAVGEQDCALMRQDVFSGNVVAT